MLVAIANVRLFGNSEVSIYNNETNDIVNTFSFGIKEAKDTAEYIIKAYNIQEVVLYGSKLITKKIGETIQTQYLNLYSKQIPITYKER